MVGIRRRRNEKYAMRRPGYYATVEFGKFWLGMFRNRPSSAASSLRGLSWTWMSHRRRTTKAGLLHRIASVHRVLHHAHGRHGVDILPTRISHRPWLARVGHRYRCPLKIGGRRTLGVHRNARERLRRAGHSAFEIRGERLHKLSRVGIRRSHVGRLRRERH